MYFLLSVSLLFISVSSTIALCTSFVYLIETPIWKDEFGVLVCVEYFLTLFYGLARGVSNLCETYSLITLYSIYELKYIGLIVVGS